MSITRATHALRALHRERWFAGQGRFLAVVLVLAAAAGCAGEEDSRDADGLGPGGAAEGAAGSGATTVGGSGGEAGGAGEGAGGAEPVVCGSVYYVDAEHGDDAWSGTLPVANAAATDGPWRTVDKVKEHSFLPGEDVHFKAGTTFEITGAQGLRIDWSGTESDPVVIGTYVYEEGVAFCSLGDEPRPVFDCEDWTYPTGDWTAAISFNEISHVEIRDLHVLNVRRTGIAGTNAHHITIRNNYIEDSGGAGIALMRSHDSLIVDNVSEKAGGQIGGCQGAIIAGGNDKVGSAYDVVIRGNTVFHSKCEGIGLYKTGQRLIVENNVVFDCENVNIYLDAVKDCTVRHNISFSTEAGMPGSGTPRTSWGISTEIEQERCNQYPQTYPGDFNSGNAIYGNLIAGVGQGIRIASLCGNSVNNKYYNNTIVSCGRGISIGQPQPGDGWSGNEIKNNLLVTFDPADRHSDGYDRPGVIWSHNLFHGGDAGAVAGTNAASGAVFADPLLSKTSGWTDLDPAAVMASFWDTAPQSPAVDSGIELDSAYATDAAGSSRPQGAGWDIGAFEK